MGDGKFIDTARASGNDGIADGRGVAVADFDLDGRLDVVINNNNAEPTLYLNRSSAAHHWLRLDLRSRGANTDAIGAKVRVTLPPTVGQPPKVLTRLVEAGSGYASQSAFPVHFGLGEAERVESVEIHWPDGDIQVLDGARMKIDSQLVVEQGS